MFTEAMKALGPSGVPFGELVRAVRDADEKTAQSLVKMLAQPLRPPEGKGPDIARLVESPEFRQRYALAMRKAFLKADDPRKFWEANPLLPLLRCYVRQGTAIDRAKSTASNLVRDRDVIRARFYEHPHDAEPIHEEEYRRTAKESLNAFHSRVADEVERTRRAIEDVQFDDLMRTPLGKALDANPDVMRAVNSMRSVPLPVEDTDQ